jgi:hypothetical protein
MGGWACIKRERCRHYVDSRRPQVAKRLCEPGQFNAFMPAAIAPVVWAIQKTPPAVAGTTA